MSYFTERSNYLMQDSCGFPGPQEYKCAIDITDYDLDRLDFWGEFLVEMAFAERRGLVKMRRDIKSGIFDKTKRGA